MSSAMNLSNEDEARIVDLASIAESHRLMAFLNQEPSYGIHNQLADRAAMLAFDLVDCQKDCLIRQPRGNIMQRKSVQSSQIASIGYDPATKKLEIEFNRSGAIYLYDDVPKEVHDRLITAESIGKAFGAEIKGKYSFTKVLAAA